MSEETINITLNTSDELKEATDKFGFHPSRINYTYTAFSFTKLLIITEQCVGKILKSMSHGVTISSGKKVETSMVKKTIGKEITYVVDSIGQLKSPACQFAFNSKKLKDNIIGIMIANDGAKPPYEYANAIGTFITEYMKSKVSVEDLKKNSGIIVHSLSRPINIYMTGAIAGSIVKQKLIEYIDCTGKSKSTSSIVATSTSKGKKGSSKKKLVKKHKK